jgi:hypothetical protein
VFYKGILVENSEFWGAKCGPPATLLGRPVCPRAQFDSIFSHCILPIENSMFICVNGKILRRRSGSLPLKSFNSPPSPSHLFQCFLHLLSCHGSLQCPIHCCSHKDDPSVERGSYRQGHVTCTSCINRLGEGLRRYEGCHRRSRRAIGDDE